MVWCVNRSAHKFGSKVYVYVFNCLRYFSRWLVLMEYVLGKWHTHYSRIRSVARRVTADDKSRTTFAWIENNRWPITYIYWLLSSNGRSLLISLFYFLLVDGYGTHRLRLAHDSCSFTVHYSDMCGSVVCTANVNFAASFDCSNLCEFRNYSFFMTIIYSCVLLTAIAMAIVWWWRTMSVRLITFVTFSIGSYARCEQEQRESIKMCW